MAAHPTTHPWLTHALPLDRTAGGGPGPAGAARSAELAARVALTLERLGLGFELGAVDIHCTVEDLEADLSYGRD